MIRARVEESEIQEERDKAEDKLERHNERERQKREKWEGLHAKSEHRRKRERDKKIQTQGGIEAGES